MYGNFLETVRLFCDDDIIYIDLSINQSISRLIREHAIIHLRHLLGR